MNVRYKTALEQIAYHVDRAAELSKLHGLPTGPLSFRATLDDARAMLAKERQEQASEQDSPSKDF